MIAIACSFVFIHKLVLLYSINDYSNLMVSGGGRNMLLLLIFMLCVMATTGRKTLFKYKVNSYAFNIVLMASCVQILALNFSLLTRLTDFYSFYITLLIPNWIDSIDNSWLRKAAIVSVVLFGALYFYYILSNDSSGIVPYQTMFK